MKNIMIIISTLLFFYGNISSLDAQIIPINHDIKNLKLGNIFFYNYRVRYTKSGSELRENQYFYNKIVRYDTISNKAYSVFQNGVRERADSSGVYWIPLSYDSTKPFTKEYLRYPLFTSNADSARLLFCTSVNFMSSNCFPEGNSFYRLIQPNFYLYPDTNYYVLGIKVRNFYVSGTLLGQANCSTLLGAWQHNYSEAFYSYSTTLCGALIEGKYYGDSACLVASSSPLQAADFTTLSLSLAPNPVSDIATLRFILPTAQGVTIEICDMLGREVAPPLRFDALSSGMNALPIDVAGLARGVYAVRLRTALGLRATTMMVKE